MLEHRARRGGQQNLQDRLHCLRPLRQDCPQQAIFLKNNVAVIDYTKCNGCGTCVAKCPKKAIQWIEGKPASIDAPGARA